MLVILLLICILSMFGQTRDSTASISLLKESKLSNISLLGGINIDYSNEFVFSLSYLYQTKSIFVLPMEVQFFYFRPNITPVLSTSVRYYSIINQNIKIYLQGGVGVTLLYPAAFFNVGIGLNYTRFTVAIRAFPPFPKPIYLLIGINF